MKSSYCILKENRLIVEYHIGKGNLQNIINFKREQATHPDFCSDFNIICDLHDLEFDITIDDLDAFVAFHQQNSHLMGQRRNGVITKTPNQVVITTLFQQRHKDLPQFISIGSTVGAAVSWVNSELTVEQITTIIEELKQRAV